MKQNSKAIHQPFSIKTLRVQRDLLKQQLYKISILAVSKHQAVLNELEMFLSNRSFMEANLDNAMQNLIQLMMMKQQAQEFLASYNAINKELKLRRIA